MKKLVFAIIFLVFVTIVSAEEFGLRNIGYDEYAYGGTEHVFFVGILNYDDSKLDDVQLRIDSPELDVFALTSPNDVKRSSSFAVPVYIPDTPGEYILRFTISAEGEDRVYYRYLTVI